ncbi:hypothetical protein Tco_0379725 [Tanacetum coccineum]
MTCTTSHKNQERALSMSNPYYVWPEHAALLDVVAFLRAPTSGIEPNSPSPRHHHSRSLSTIEVDSGRI